MTIRELKQLIKLCRDTGVYELKIDNVELKLGQEPVKAVKTIKQPTYAPGGITEDTQITTDELTDEQLLYYSATTNDSVQQ